MSTCLKKDLYIKEVYYWLVELFLNFIMSGWILFKFLKVPLKQKILQPSIERILNILVILILKINFYNESTKE